MANLCNYSVRLNTTDIVKNEPECGFSICAFALALFNRVLSLTLPGGSEQSARPEHIGYCWGPRKDSIIQSLQYYSETRGNVRMKPPKLLRGGLHMSGWPWEMSTNTQVNVQTTHGLPPVDDRTKFFDAFGVLIEDIGNRGLTDLADMLREQHTLATSPSNDELYDPYEPVPQSEASDEEMIEAFDPRKMTWEDLVNSTPFWTWILRQGLTDKTIQAARLNKIHFPNGNNKESVNNAAGSSPSETNWVSNVNPSAVFDPQNSNQTSHTPSDNPYSTLYIFTPDTILDNTMARTERRGDPLSWVLEHHTLLKGFLRIPRQAFPSYEDFELVEVIGRFQKEQSHRSLCLSNS